MPGESSEDRHNRELIELLNELRVALPGVQVLFAFLLAVPLANGFRSSAGPSSYHRLRWRRHDKERMLVSSNALTIAGLACLAVAITCVVFVITDFLFHRAWAATFTAFVAAAFLGLWYGLPLASAIQDRRRPTRSR